jgi:hypothetical protein
MAALQKISDEKFPALTVMSWQHDEGSMRRVAFSTVADN